MHATLVGYRTMDFTDDKGRRVCGASLFLVYDGNGDNIVGQMAGKVFYKGNVRPDWVGQAVKLEYTFDPVTKNGRLKEVTLAK